MDMVLLRRLNLKHYVGASNADQVEIIKIDMVIVTISSI